ncbi:CobD/CbiB family cobalamin biosynthesis protein [Halorarius litoreus]|uniref:CobD/CbiB family cobalamin biosynthesis protein n=1 Tax=Halorarius litoreus TaxID=2962676 RepID=UPI0020CBFC08|nr:CobD/CbiB family cobalamin biosynthesis protein [Halorarius litoreus]
MSVLAAGAVLLAAALDWLVAEPPTRLHPVVWYGRLLAPLDREWAQPWLVGLLAPVFAIGAALGVAGLVTLAGWLHPLAAGLLAGLVLFSTTSRRMLLEEARAVVTLSDSDPGAARDRLPALAGRDPTQLSPGELRSAAVESAAENLADGLVAPLLAFALGALVSLPVAAGAAAFVKAVNTGDSMLGYRSKPVGWASARLDDLVMFVPARVSAALLAAAAVAPASLTRASAWADTPPSPNSGWPMATVAAAVDRRLDKPGVYTLNPDAPLPDREAADHGVTLVGRAGLLAVALAGVVAWF